MHTAPNMRATMSYCKYLGTTAGKQMETAELFPIWSPRGGTIFRVDHRSKKTCFAERIFPSTPQMCKILKDILRDVVKPTNGWKTFWKMLYGLGNVCKMLQCCWNCIFLNFEIIHNIFQHSLSHNASLIRISTICMFYAISKNVFQFVAHLRGTRKYPLGETCLCWTMVKPKNGPSSRASDRKKLRGSHVFVRNRAHILAIT